ncbi:MAG: cytochrome P450 [Mycobacterium sp.]|uniref:cytochrome P450 n=1 Tax=Mycobacterium sp. TaxID=1785 RepID=UPI003F9BAC9B
MHSTNPSARGSLTKATPATFDALDESFQSDPFPTLCALRDQCAAFRDAVLPAVHVLRYAECQAILQNPVGFTNDFAWAIQPYLESMPELAAELPPLFLATDGAEHHRLRSLANRAFSQRSVGQIEEHVHRLTEALLTEAIEQRDVDFIEAVAYALPVQVIAEMLGLPTADREWFKDWATRFAEGFGSAVFGVPEPHVIAAQVATFREMHTYLRPLVEERREAPKEDLLSRLVLAEENGDRLTMPELMQMVAGLLPAGHETTTNLIAHTVVELARHPTELARLRADPGLIPSAVEEVARLGGPTFGLLRVAADETEIAGVEVGEGELVILWASAAHRDPDVFDRPDTFDVGRDPNPHFAFSRGPHFCLGAQLARMEARIVLAHLLDSTSSFELLSEELPLHPSPILRGYTELPVRLTPRR